MSSSAEIERLQAEASYCRDRVSLTRAKLYSLAWGPSGRLRELERELELAEQRPRDERLRAITNHSVDWSQLDPIVTAALDELARAGVRQRQRGRARRLAVLERGAHGRGDANKHSQVLIPPEASERDEPRKGWTGGRYDWMRTALATDLGKQLPKTESK